MEENKTPPKNSFDIDRLAVAVAKAETGNCTRGSGKSKNNCFGIMEWKNGKRMLKTYATKEESYKDFKRIWAKSYKKFPDRSMAEKWTGSDNAETWLKNVKSNY